MLRLISTTFLLIFFSANLTAKEYTEKKSWNVYLELNQMFTLNIGVEYFLNNNWSIKGVVGTTPFSITSFTYNLLGVYHLKKPGDTWLIDFEFGVPIAYFDQFEGRYVDNDPIIDDPYAGWLFGISFLFSYNFGASSLGLRIGAGWWKEHQRDSGWKGDRVLPVVAIVWDF